MNSLRSAWRSISQFIPGLQLFGWILILGASIPCRAEKTLNLPGTLLNRVNWSGHYPVDETFTLELTFDEQQKDSYPLNPRIGYYDGALIQAKLSLSGSGFTKSGKVSAPSLRIDLDAAFGVPVITANFILGDSSAPDSLFVDLKWFADPKFSDLNDTITQDLSPERFRFIEVKVSERPNAASEPTLAGFGWVRRPPSGSATPGPLRKLGYRELFVFGDSLSASHNPQVDPATKSLYFEDGYCNGPVWVQHLAWRMGIPFREENNLSKFGSFTSIDPALFNGKAVAESLAINWVNTDVFQSIVSLVFTGGSIKEGTPYAASLDMENHIEFLHTAEIVDYFGIHDLLILGAADIGFAPGVKKYLSTPEKRASLRAFVTASNQRRAQIVTTLNQLFPNLRTQLIDPNLYLDRIVATPAAYGIKNLEVGALDGDPASGINPITDKSLEGPGADYFFWNGFAPTTKVHCYLADAVYNDVFSRGTAAEHEPQLRLIRWNVEQVRIYAWNLTPKTVIELQQSLDLRHWSVTDDGIVNEPCRLFDVLRTPGEIGRLFRLGTQ